MSADNQCTDDLGTGTNIDVALDSRRPAAARSYRDLLEQEAIGTNLCVRMDDDPVRVGHEQPTTQAAVQGDIGTGDDAPPAVAQHC